jgi:lipopolysaccharide/colanic/teichoic acid biosynthesis glycosyltransferase
MLAVALAIRLDGPGPVLFRQKRHGFNNTEFEVFKFRSMRWEQRDALGTRQTSRDDNRITKFGAFLRTTSLDELPQLLNVLRGDMSIVGPRPHPIGMRTANRLCEDIVEEYAHRHRVRPGITGLAQVQGFRGATQTAAQLQRRIELDLHYIDNWSIMFDLKIILLTVLAVLRRENAF